MNAFHAVVRPVRPALLLLAVAAHCVEAQQESSSTLWYRQPAAEWNQALPVGNGRLGAMVFGGTAQEHIQLNEETLWTGGPYDPVVKGASAALPEIRRLLFAGDVPRAHDLFGRTMMGVPYEQMKYQPLGDLLMAFPFQMDGVAPNGLRITGQNSAYLGIAGTLTYEARLVARAEGGRGTVSTDYRTLRVTGADAVTIVLAAATSFVNYKDVSVNPAERVRMVLHRASAREYAAMLHVQVHGGASVTVDGRRVRVVRVAPDAIEFAATAGRVYQPDFGPAR